MQFKELILPKGPPRFLRAVARYMTSLCSDYDPKGAKLHVLRYKAFL